MRSSNGTAVGPLKEKFTFHEIKSYTRSVFGENKGVYQVHDNYMSNDYALDY